MAELREAHGQCVAWLYAIAGNLACPTDRAAVSEHLQALSSLLGDTTVDVVVVGARGHGLPLSNSAPLLLEVQAKLDTWTEGAAPAWLLASAGACLRALGWREPPT